MSGLMGLMGVMSLVEAYKLYQFREQRTLHKHPLFQIARSGVATRHDGMGIVATLNREDMDDPLEYDLPQAAPCCCCPWISGPQDEPCFEDDVAQLANFDAISP